MTVIRSRRRAFGLAALAALTFVATLVVSRRGLFFTPDSWAYWEGSVSLAAGRGDSILGTDVTFRPWPPLTSLYLAAWELVFDASVQTLRWAMAAAAVATALAWTRFAGALGARGAARWGMALLAAAFAARELSWLLSESLTLPLLALALTSWLRLVAAPGARPALWLALGLALLLLARNASWVFLPVLVAVTPWVAPEDERRRAAAWSAAAAATAGAAWWAVRAALGQSGSHALESGPMAPRLARRGGELLRGLAGREGDALAGFGWLLPLTLLVSLALVWRRRREPAGGRAAAALALALGSSLLLVPLTAAVRVFDPIQGRFLWPVLLLAGAALATLAAEPATGTGRRTAGLLLAALAAVALARWGDAAWRFEPRPFDPKRDVRATGLLPPAIFLDPGHATGPPAPRGEGWVVAPPPELRWSRLRTSDSRRGRRGTRAAPPG